MKKLFLKTKPSAIFILLKDSQQAWYPSKLARASNSSYVHTVNMLAQLRKLGIVSMEKKGRQSIYVLTERGMHLANALEDFSKKCDALEQEQKAQRASESEKAAPQQQSQQPAEAAKRLEKQPEQEKK